MSSKSFEEQLKKPASSKSLEDLLNAADDPVSLLRNRQTGPNVYPGVPAEFTNWRDEQRALQETCVLFNQSYHMADLAVTGPDALKLFSDLGVNTFKNFAPGAAKQFVACGHDGHVVGDAILFYLGEQTFNLVGREPALHWAEFHAKSGRYDLTAEYDERSAERADPFDRKTFRFQIQGPNALQVLEKASGRPAPDVKFFHMGWTTIAGRDVGALRHGMAGQKGFELFGAWADGAAVLDALLRAGEEFGLHQSGGRAYGSNTLESGWIPCPLPAIYTGEKMKPYRQWLSEDSFEGRASLGGSFTPKTIDECYITPWDIGYGPFVKFDHDFIGREALEKMADRPHRRKVTLALDNDDVLGVIGTIFKKDGRGKFIEFPSAVYAMYPYDKVTAGGRTVGISTWVGYSSNEAKMLTLAMVDEAFAEPGTKVTLVWGEEGGGTAKPRVERHIQMEIGAVVHPAPYAKAAREVYDDGGWRRRVAAARV